MGKNVYITLWQTLFRIIYIKFYKNHPSFVEDITKHFRLLFFLDTVYISPYVIGDILHFVWLFRLPGGCTAGTTSQESWPIGCAKGMIAVSAQSRHTNLQYCLNHQHAIFSCIDNIYIFITKYNLSLIHIWRCRRIERCRSRWSPYH